MAAPIAVPSAAKPRDRSIAARRAARVAKFERERLIVDSLNRGVSVAEIARRIGVTEKRMGALASEILARRLPEAPEDFAALQASRLNEALLAAWSAMSPDNLEAVALVVRIAREIDRYHGFAASGRPPRREPRADAEAQETPALAETASREWKQASIPEPGDVEARSASSANRPEKAPQAIEKMESAPDTGAVLNPREAPAQRAEDAPSARRSDAPESSKKAFSPPAARPPQPDPASRASCAGAEKAPQAIENIDSAPGNDANPAAAEPAEGGVAGRGGFRFARRRAEAVAAGERRRNALAAGKSITPWLRLWCRIPTRRAASDGSFSGRRPTAGRPVGKAHGGP